MRSSLRQTTMRLLLVLRGRFAVGNQAGQGGIRLTDLLAGSLHQRLDYAGRLAALLKALLNLRSLLAHSVQALAQ